jgi:hypothetical protein
VEEVAIEVAARFRLDKPDVYERTPVEQFVPQLKHDEQSNG